MIVCAVSAETRSHSLHIQSVKQKENPFLTLFVVKQTVVKNCLISIVKTVKCYYIYVFYGKNNFYCKLE
jgi:hypothetical protein